MLEGIKEILFMLFKYNGENRLEKILFRSQLYKILKRYRHDRLYDVNSSLDWSDGYFVKHLSLRDELLASLSSIKYFDSQGHGHILDEIRQGGLDEVRFVSQSQLHTKIPELQKFSATDEIMELVYDYLGENAFLANSIAWLTLPDIDHDSFEYKFHYDINNTKWLNVFVYLNDVDLQKGPHSCIEGTTERKHLLSFVERRLTVNRALKLYGDKRIRVFTGDAGTAVFEDTSNYHRALPVTEGYRWMLQLNYSNVKLMDLE